MRISMLEGKLSLPYEWTAASAFYCVANQVSATI